MVVRPCPVLFQLPATAASAQGNVMKSNLPYRSVFAVLTLDSLLLYDTYHLTPLAVARGLHYASLTDCAWTCDGSTLIISSRDGYLSFISFNKGELGEVYTPPPTVTPTSVIPPKEEDVIVGTATQVRSSTAMCSAVDSTFQPSELSCKFLFVCSLLNFILFKIKFLITLFIFLDPLHSAHFIDAPPASLEKQKQQQPEQRKEDPEGEKPTNTKKRVALTLVRPLNNSNDGKLSKTDAISVLSQTVEPKTPNSHPKNENDASNEGKPVDPTSMLLTA